MLTEGVSSNCTGIHLPHCKTLKHYLGRHGKQPGEVNHSSAEASMLHAGRASQRESRLTARTLYNALVAFPEFIITPYSLMYDKKSCRSQVTTGLCQGSLFQASSPVSSSVYFQKLLRVPCFKIQEVGTLPVNTCVRFSTKLGSIISTSNSIP